MARGVLVPALPAGQAWPRDPAVSYAVLSSPGFGGVLLSVVPSTQQGAMGAGCKYVLTVLAARLPVTGGIVYANEGEFIDELALRTGLDAKRVRAELTSAMKLGWLFRRKVVGQAHVELQPVVPNRLAVDQVKTMRMEVGEVPRTVYAVSELTVDAIGAALKEADEESGSAPADVERGSGGGADPGREAGGGATQPCLLGDEQPRGPG